MLRELIEYSHSIKKTQAEVKVTLREIKKIYKEPAMEGKKPRIKSTIWNIRKKEAFNQNSK